MNVEEFLERIQATINKAGTLPNLSANMARPSATLQDLYGPMTNKILKKNAVEKAHELYEAYYVTNNPAFVSAVLKLRNQINAMPTEVTQGAVSSLTALVHMTQCFNTNLKSITDKVKEPPGFMSGLLLSVMDASITSGLACVPVAGPFLAPLSMGINGAISYGINASLQYSINDDRLLFNSGSAEQSTSQKAAISNTDSSVQARNQNLANAATTAGKTTANIASAMTGTIDKAGVAGQMVAAKGFASMAAIMIKALVKRNEDQVLAMADTKGNAFKNLVTAATTQNQTVAENINVVSRLDLNVPSSLQTDSKRTAMYMDETATLDTFKTATATMFNDFYTFLLDLMGSGIEASFKDALIDVKMPQCTDNAERIAILIMGYFYAKDWSGARKAAIAQATDTFNTLPGKIADEQMRLHQLEEQFKQTQWGSKDSIKAFRSIKEKKLQLAGQKEEFSNAIQVLSQGSKQDFTKNYGKQSVKSAQNAFDLAKKSSSKAGLQRLVQFQSSDAKYDMEKLTLVTDCAKNYFRALKNAMTSDIETTMQKGNGGFLSDKEMKQMWSLYVGSHLIVNLVLRDTKLKMQSKLKKATTAFSITDSTKIPDYYVDLIESGGFIERYTGWAFGHVSDDKKKKLAATGKMRWSRNPSDNERAMLTVFCMVVAFSMDVGKISLGFYSWTKTKESLAEIAKTISATAYT